jgi:ArsR family transcriptional regulator
MISNVVEPMTTKTRTKTRTETPEVPDSLEQELVQVFKLLSDETRLRVLMHLLHEKELHVTALCERLGQSQPAVSHHLALLRVAGLIEARRDGKHNFYSVKVPQMKRLISEILSSLQGLDHEELQFDAMPVFRSRYSSKAE